MANCPADHLQGRGEHAAETQGGGGRAELALQQSRSRKMSLGCCGRQETVNKKDDKCTLKLFASRQTHLKVTREGPSPFGPK